MTYIDTTPSNYIEEDIAWLFGLYCVRARTGWTETYESKGEEELEEVCIAEQLLNWKSMGAVLVQSSYGSMVAVRSPEDCGKP